MRFIRHCGLMAAIALAACGGDTTGPGSTQYAVAVQTGDLQFGTRNAALADPLQVIVTDPSSKAPQKDVTVTWSITQGTGATLSTTTSVTNSKGVASVQLTLGGLGTYVVEASPPRVLGSVAKFTAKAVDAPAMTSVTPNAVKAGDTVTIAGTNFSPIADENIVLFGGFRGKVTTASATQLRAVVPLCVPTRTQVGVQTMLGAVSGNQLNIAVSGSSTATPLQLTRGQVRVFTDPNELACFPFPAGVPGLSLLLVPQNFSEVVGSITTYEIAGQIGGGVVTEPVTQFATHTHDFASEWELQLRAREQKLLQQPAALLRPQPLSQRSMLAGCTASPAVGDRCDFQVSNSQNRFQTVTGEVKAVGTRVVVYQDINAPANGLIGSDFTYLANVFDDPIYAIDVATYGPPSDLDANNKIIILLTPVVNSLTPKGTSGFVAGFFYACDLLPRTACAGSNNGEVFYALTADPTAQFSDARSRETVTRALPAVLAHEFQHMINFGQRGNNTIEALWLSEGMAHNAEDVVGDEFERRGDLTTASTFRSQNTLRGNRFLRATASTSLLSEEDASLEMRGGAWLFVKYLEGRFGKTMLQKLTHTTLSSVANVTAQTGRSWSSLLSDFAVALYADDNPELAGATVNSIYSFPTTNLRSRLANSNGSYPIQPATYGFTDFLQRETLEASAQSYVVVTSANGANSLNMTFTGLRGGAFAINAAPQLSIMRLH